MTQTHARYNSIFFRGEDTFAVLFTPTGEVRARVPHSLKDLFSSHNIGKHFTVTLTNTKKSGWSVEADIQTAQEILLEDA